MSAVLGFLESSSTNFTTSWIKLSALIEGDSVV